MSTDKSAAAIREILKKYDEKPYSDISSCLSDLTALISEHYYPKEFVEWLFGHSLVWDEKTMTWFTQIERAFNYWKENER